jgi:HlyD family secretion protein
MAQKSGGSWLVWIVIIVILVGGAGGYFYFAHNRIKPVTYVTEPAARGELTKVVTATGTLNPVVNVTVGSQVSGRISKLNVDYNTIVKSNQVIAEIDPAIYQAAVQQSDADLANAKANLELQQVEAERNADLYTNKLISESDFDSAIATLHEAEATVKIKEASLSNSVVNLAYCKILSPVDGVVILRAVELGQTVASSFNTPTIFQIANDLTRMQIDSSVAEADVGGIVEGQVVDFTVDAYPDRTFHGGVTQVRNSPTTVNNVVTYDCVIGVTNADYKLKPGMTANVSVIVDHRDNALLIPNGALRFRVPDNVTVITNDASPAAANTNPAAGVATNVPSAGAHRSGHAHGERPAFHTIYVLTGTGDQAQLHAVKVKTGISDGISTEVISGLDEGTQVVTGAYQAGQAAAANPLGGGGFPRMR